MNYPIYSYHNNSDLGYMDPEWHDVPEIEEYLEDEEEEEVVKVSTEYEVS
jgi:hypothetical protein